MGKRLISTLLVLLTIGAQAFAQSAVSGKVTDKAGEPLVGVNVLVKGTNAGTMTDLDGNWTIANVESNAVIVFSSIGFSSREVTVGTKKVINVVLEDDTNFLDEVVVVGYGTARRRDLSGSIASVNYANDKNISTLPNPNALSALSSKVTVKQGCRIQLCAYKQRRWRQHRYHDNPWKELHPFKCRSRITKREPADARH